MTKPTERKIGATQVTERKKRSIVKKPVSPIGAASLTPAAPEPPPPPPTPPTPDKTPGPVGKTVVMADKTPATETVAATETAVQATAAKSKKAADGEKSATAKKADTPSSDTKGKKRAAKDETPAAAPVEGLEQPKKSAKTRKTQKSTVADIETTAPPTEKTVEKTTETAPTDMGQSTSLSSEKLVQMQIQRQEEISKENQRWTQMQEQGQAKKQAPPPAPAEGKAEKKKDGTIKIDPKAVTAHHRKLKQKVAQTRAREKVAENVHVFQKPVAPVVREIKIPDAISVNQLASEMSLKSGVIIRALMNHGMSVTANQNLDKETAWIIVEELGHKPVEAPIDDLEQTLLNRRLDNVEETPRAPVVTVMGHVDHGKTSLLDYIRKTRVAHGESGGITQHIGAYRVESSIGAVTFIDTPGHALFTQMRARGAKITDIIVLVVAADDGVKPQTVEAINHAKAANVPIIIAANKIDKPEADMEKLKRELAEQDVLPEDWGGDALVVGISAATGEGVDELLNALAIQTELLELKAPINVPAAGIVVETRIERGRGIVATLIVKEGVLKRGDAFLCGAESGRIRTMWNAASPSVDEARPSEPVEIQGFSGVPAAGAELIVMGDERQAREIATLRQNKTRARLTSKKLAPGATPDNLLAMGAEEEARKDLNVVVKADVGGSREALAAALGAIAGKNAGVKIVHSAVGSVTESDIYLAQTSGGIIVAFNIRPDGKTRKLAESRGIKIITGNVVYDLVEKVKHEVLNLLPPIVTETVVGTADVLQVFNISKVGNIAGCRVTEGVVPAGGLIRLLRDSAVVYEGKISTLRHFTNDVAEVRVGSECGIGIAKFNDIKTGDVIEALERTETAPEM